MATFDVEMALKAGKTEDQILGYLSSQNPSFHSDEAIAAGKTKRQIIDFLATHVNIAPPSPSFSEKALKGIGNMALNTVTEGGPAALGAIGGGIVAGPPGAVLGGMLGEGTKQFIRRASPTPAPSLMENWTQQGLAGLQGVLAPESAAARYPLGARMGQMGEQVPPRMAGQEARQIVGTAGERAPMLTDQFKMQRSLATDAARNEKAQAQMAFNQRVQDNIEPLRAERNRLLNQRTNASAALAEQRTATTEGTRNALTELNAATQQAKIDAGKEAIENAEVFSQSVGREMNKTGIARGTLESRSLGLKAYTEKVTKLYDKIRDDIFASNTEKVPTGEPVASKTLGPDGKPYMVQPMRDVAGPINRTALQDDLRDFAASYREKLTIAKQNGSPGAKAILDIVDGPAIVEGRTAIDDLAALNKFGYSQSDAELRTVGEALTRKVAKQYGTAMRESIAKMKGGDEAIKMLDEAKVLLAKRDEIFRTGPDVDVPIARRGAIGVIQSGGNVLNLVNNPVKMRAVYGQVDEATKAGMQRQISEWTLGKSHGDFAKNWNKLDPEVKSLNYTPEQIAKADALAARGPAALESIANNALVENARIISDSTQKLKLIGQERMRLADTTVQVRQLNAQIRAEGNVIRKAKLESDLQMVNKAAETKQAIDRAEAVAKQNFEIQIKTARARLDEIKTAKDRLMKGAAVIGAGALAWKARDIGTILGISW